MPTVLPTTSYVTVTPQLAERWLQNNTVNRTIREMKVNQYARDMETDRWGLSNDAIAFSQDGQLLNGQHRLRAVIKSGKTISFLVVRNMPPEAMTIMDSGVSRTASDALKFMGEHHTATLAATARLSLLYMDGRIYRDNKVQSVSHGEVLDFVDQHPSIRQSIDEVGSAHRSIDAPTSSVMTAHWLIAGVNETPLATYYIHQLATRVNEPTDSAVLAVDSRLRELRRNRAFYPPRNFLYLLVKGWNYYAKDERIRTLLIQPRGQFRIPDPAKWERS